MKKILALLLVLSILLALTACGGDSIATPTEESGDPHLSATGGSVPTSTPTTGTTEPPVTEPSTTEPPVADGEGNEPPTTEPPVTEPPATKPSTTPHATEAPTQPTTPTVPSTQPTQPTTPTTPTQPTTPTTPSDNWWENWNPWEDEELPEIPIKEYLGWEIVNIQRNDNTYYCANGQDLLSRMYGQDKAFQYGDIITIRLKFKDVIPVEEEDFRISDYSNCTYEVNGDCITLYVGQNVLNTAHTQVHVGIDFFHSTENADVIIFSIVHSDNVADNQLVMRAEFISYAKRLGLKYYGDAHEVGSGYTSFTDDSGSLTGWIGTGCDDYVPIYSSETYPSVVANPDWIEEVLWLLDEYSKMGFTKVHFDPWWYGFAFVAI